MANIIRPSLILPGTETRFQSFILFEPASSRVSELDIMARGEHVVDMLDTIMAELSQDDSLKTVIIRNRLSKIAQMISLLSNYDNVILSKFFDRIWRRYGYISNIGEPFLDFKSFSGFFPDLVKDPTTITAQRLDDDDDEDMDGGSDSDTDSTSVSDTVSLDDAPELSDPDSGDSNT
jgi:hypothetical protein